MIPTPEPSPRLDRPPGERLRPLVLGASGLVGGALFERFHARGHEPIGTYRGHAKPGLRRFDLEQGLDWVGDEGLEPGLVVLTAAMTHVDRCETHPDEARAQNVEAADRVVRWCRAAACPLLYYSTDYVFDGAAGPYAEDAGTHPLSVYGRTKLEAERLVLTLPRALVVRITNAFDIGQDDRNFVHRCVTSFRDRRPLVVPSDQLATPTYATWLADQCVTLLERGAILRADSPRVLHAGCDDWVSRGELARRIAARLGADASLLAERPTAELGQAAPRPLRGGLRNDAWKRLLGVERLELDAALDDCLPRMRRLYAATH